MLSFFTNNKNTVIGIALALIGLGLYFLGYDRAETKYLLEIESMKLANAQAIIDAQNDVKVQYEKDVQKLSQALADAHRLNNDRLLQLEQFNGADRDLAACLSDRGALARVAVGLEDVAIRAIVNLENVVK